MSVKNGSDLNCRVCNKIFYVSLYRVKKAKYCSQKCLGISRIGVPNYFNIDKGNTVIFKCEQCRKETKIRLAFYNKAKHHFCSSKCANTYLGKNKSGKNHWNWKNGKTDENHLLRHSIKYKEWRIGVYSRDFYICQMCKVKCRTKNIVAHHLDSFNDYPEKRYLIENGITLCRSCHKKVHKKIGIKTRFNV